MATPLPLLDEESPEEAPPSSPPSRGRRRLLGALVGGAVAATAGLFAKKTEASTKTWLRPPGAQAGEGFTDNCVRCFKCVDACPNGCLDVHPLSSGLQLALSPRLHARTRACILCGECADVCPTGALQPFVANAEGWLAGVDMGLARVNRDLCYSFHGRTCGACYRACPIAGTAMKIGVFETPHIQPEHCVGCGLCEQACLHLPQAIRVLPREKVGPRTRREGRNKDPMAVHGPFGERLGTGPRRWGPVSQTADDANAANAADAAQAAKKASQ